MPAIEAQEDEATDEVVHYECAFHILPTIAEPEVSGVVEELKGLITRSGGIITDEEVSERYNLAYEITKQVDGVNRRFNAAHFGWMRFALAPSALGGVVDELQHKPEILRYLIIRLTREETQKPFALFETRRAQVRSAAASRKKHEDVNEAGEISEEALDQSLEKITAE